MADSTKNAETNVSASKKNDTEENPVKSKGSEQSKGLVKAPAKKVVKKQPQQEVLPPSQRRASNRPDLRKRPKKRRGFGRVLFFLMVILPTILVGFYYYSIASDQYQSETSFSVRGTNTSPLEMLGLNALPGNSIQASDAYVVIHYIRSLQMLNDMQEKIGIDIRDFFSKDSIDPIYRIDPDLPLEEFLWYWQWMIDASFNSTTGITTFRVNAFSSEDAVKISLMVKTLAVELVNDLSTDARKQLIESAQTEVLRTEGRLASARLALEEFRNREQSLNPTKQAESDQELVQELQSKLIDLQSRRTALRLSVDAKSPAVRVLDRQIVAAKQELSAQKENFGSGDTKEPSNQRNLSNVLGDYETLKLEEEFAQKIYTTALASFETSQTEARKQERYFATIINPTKPDIALYPLRIINTIVAFAVFFVLWLLTYLMLQAIRDHSV